MSETITLITEPAIDTTSEPVSAPAASIAIPTDRGATASLVALSPPPTDARSLLELIASALAPEADEAARAGAREALAQLAHPVATTSAAIPGAPPVQVALAVPGAPLVSAVQTPF